MSQADPRMDGIARLRPTHSTAAADRLSILIVLFLVGMVFSLIVHLGPLRLSSYRIVLFLCVIPCLILWVAGRAGPIRTTQTSASRIGPARPATQRIRQGITQRKSTMR